MNVISLIDAKKGIEKAAFNWAISEQERIGLVAGLLFLEPEHEELEEYEEGFVPSVFYDEESGKALLRRDWLKDGAVRYDVLTNFEEIKKRTPKVAQTLRENAIRVYRHFDGPNGGITKKIKDITI